MTKESNSDVKTNFISRYKQVFTREECRKIIEEIEVFDSSKLFEKIPTNLNLSSKGTFLSEASSSTLKLKSSQLSSLFIYFIEFFIYVNILF